MRLFINPGEMVKEVLEKYQGTNQIKVKLVHASKGKFARAEPVAVLYERGRIAHRKHISRVNLGFF